uniref:Uncharacterized protein n=1 Tax=Dunaliella tertiolecta TaxID=3047 RepID=A0A7S3QLK7_DUNTE|mmetsp:Transcript_5591/g.15053  ORF Transcript_5591/g.15053 Transcript_5591/m.15053 type:complete len:316 (-) Transcript_5591:216-1163(-)
MLLQSTSNPAGFRGGVSRSTVSPPILHKCQFRNSRARQPVQPLRAQSASTASLSSEDDLYGGECIPCWVSVDNSDEKFTKLTVDVGDYGGLLRTIAWVLTGSETCVHHAAISTNQDEMAHNIYWLTDMKGRKLSDRAASYLQDTMQNVVEFCKPRIKSLQEWTSGNVNITNMRNDRYSIITVCGDPKLHRRYGGVLKEGFFFELCSLITSCGCVVKQAQVIGSDSPPEEVANCLGCKLCMPAQNEHAQPQDPPYDFSLGPFYRFCVTDVEGKKLGAPQASAFLTMYNMIHGSGHMPLHPPNTDNYALAAAGAFVE